MRVSQVGAGVGGEGEGETLCENMTLELKLQLQDTGPEDLVGKNILDRVRQNRNMSCILFGKPVQLKHNMETRVS